ncbi:DUF4333 domain-containing protein [Streptomyces niveiscabiei]|uniref:DUF4333 domain-containing protein n=1 Tax=Streptomyces niveiscabiei TaxID=164115 RepID=UPI0029AE88EE|nr:DUF4333 domain-containing protein [Streptomyces niveiscabiei]MDX3384657.1 DUF4333 domain-containing protein [Streptomyces niveiscabiei]
MQHNRFLVGALGGVVAVAALGGVVTYFMADTESTTPLDDYTVVRVDGQRALSPNIVAGRTASKFHPLPWVGDKLTGVTCPTGLKAVVGASLTCTGEKSGGGTVKIPVRVTKADAKSLTWKFDR